MTPELRAIADRFMYETATLKHVIALLPEDGLDRTVPGHEWTVRQHLAHLAHSLHIYQEPVRRWQEGEDPLAGWDPDATNAETARRHAATTRRELLDMFDAGIRGLVACFAGIPDEKMDEAFGSSEPLKVFQAFEGHIQTHAIALIDAVPEVRMDPLVLNWLLWARFDSESESEWQRALLQEAREYAANHPEEDEE